MPTVMKIGSFRFHFYSDEGNEPPHIHVATPDGECKFWLQPVRLARNSNSTVLLDRIDRIYMIFFFILLISYFESSIIDLISASI